MEELTATYVTEVCSLPSQATPTHQQPPVVSALVVLRTCTPLMAGEELNMLKALSLRQQQPSILNSSSNGKLQPAMLPSVSVSRNHSAFRSLHSAQALLAYGKRDMLELNVYQSLMRDGSNVESAAAMKSRTTALPGPAATKHVPPSAARDGTCSQRPSGCQDRWSHLTYTECS